jgi:hypothetical protein
MIKKRRTSEGEGEEDEGSVDFYDRDGAFFFFSETELRR